MIFETKPAGMNVLMVIADKGDNSVIDTLANNRPVYAGFLQVAILKDKAYKATVDDLIKRHSR